MDAAAADDLAVPFGEQNVRQVGEVAAEALDLRAAGAGVCAVLRRVEPHPRRERRGLAVELGPVRVGGQVERHVVRRPDVAVAALLEECVRVRAAVHRHAGEDVGVLRVAEHGAAVGAHQRLRPLEQRAADAPVPVFGLHAEQKQRVLPHDREAHRQAACAAVDQHLRAAADAEALFERGAVGAQGGKARVIERVQRVQNGFGQVLKLRRDDQHHRAAHFVGHAGQAAHRFGRHRLLHVAQREAAVEQRLEIRRHGAVVLRHRLAEEMRGARALVIVVVHREMVDVARCVEDPVLRALSGKDGVLDRKDELPAGLQPAPHLFDDGRVIGDVVQRKRAEHEVEAVLGKLERLDRALPVRDAFGKLRVAGDLAARDLEHARRNVDAERRFRAVLDGPDAVPAVAAAEVEHALVFDRRQHGPERFHSPAPESPSRERAIWLYFSKKTDCRRCSPSCRSPPDVKIQLHYSGKGAQSQAVFGKLRGKSGCRACAPAKNVRY